MGWAFTLVALAIAQNADLDDGVARYARGEYGPALSALSRVAESRAPKRERALAHLYVGLIQIRFERTDDARTSFERAVALDANVKLPAGAPVRAIALLESLRPAPRRPRPRARPPPPEDSASRLEPLDAPTWQPPARTEPGFPLTAPEAMEPGVVPATVQDEVSGTEVASWVAVGVGGVAFAGAVTFGALSGSNRSAALSEPSASRAEALYETSGDQRTISAVAIGIAAVGFATALVLYVSTAD